MSRGSSVSHSSSGRAASTVISSLPLGRRRTRPGSAGPSGITSCSRWMPSASVTAKIASISFIVTTSSIDADLGGAGLDLPPRLVVDGYAAGAALARDALLGLARDQDLLGAAGQRRRPYEAEERGDLRVEIAGRQEAAGIDADHQDAVAHRPLVGTRGPRARQDTAQDLDGQREPVALVLAGRDQGPGRVRVVLARIGRRLAATVAHDAGRDLLAAVELHLQLALGDDAGGEVV